MEVRHERPSSDIQFRVTAPLILGLADGDSLQIRQWNLRGVHDARLQGRDLAGVVLSIPFQGVNIYFPVTLTPGTTEDEFLFADLTGRQRETLALFYRNLLSGRMASTDEVITALDTPVDLVPMGETEAERNLAGVQVPRKLRVGTHVFGYIAAFLLVFAFLISLLWTRLSYIEVTQAYVLDQTLVANDDARLVPGAEKTVVAMLPPDVVLEVWPGMEVAVRFSVHGQTESIDGTVQAVMAADVTAPLGLRLVIVPDMPADPATAVALPTHLTPVHVELQRARLRRLFGMRVGASEQ